MAGDISQDKISMARATKRSRLALAAACGDRVRPIYNDYWEGDEHTATVDRAVEIGWTYALTEVHDANEVSQAAAELTELREFYLEEGYDLLSAVVAVAIRILEALSEPEEESALAAARAIGSCLEASSCVDAIVTQTSEEGPAEREEEAWLDAAISLAVGQPLPTRDMFLNAGAMPPNWWPVFQAAPEHI